MAVHLAACMWILISAGSVLNQSRALWAIWACSNCQLQLWTTHTTQL